MESDRTTPRHGRRPYAEFDPRGTRLEAAHMVAGWNHRATGARTCTRRSVPLSRWCLRLLVAAACFALSGECAVAQTRPSPPNAPPFPPSAPPLPPNSPVPRQPYSIPPNAQAVPWGFGNICSNESGWCNLSGPRPLNSGCVCLTATNQQVAGIVRVIFFEGPPSPYLRPHTLTPPRF